MAISRLGGNQKNRSQSLQARNSIFWRNPMNLLKTLIAAAALLLSATAFAAVDANKASQAELESIKGIGPAASTRILDERKKSSFKDWADLVDRVKGIGSGNAAKFSTAGLTVNGAAYDAGSAATSAKPAEGGTKTAKAAAKPMK